MRNNIIYTVVLMITTVAFSIGQTTNSNASEELNNNVTDQVSVANYPYPVGVLFANEDYTYFIEHVTDPGDTDSFMVAGYDGSSTIDILEEGTALVTFVEHPQEWNGGGTLAQRPVQLDPYNVNFDLSEVKTITFEVRSADFDVNQISFGVQWQGPDYNIDVPSKRSGGEKLITLEELGINDITDWTKVTINVSKNGDILETGTLRHEHTEVAFHAEGGNTYVKVPLMMIWAGRSHKTGESFEIRGIAFRNENGEHVDIATAILVKAAEHADRK